MRIIALFLLFLLSQVACSDKNSMVAPKISKPNLHTFLQLVEGDDVFPLLYRNEEKNYSIHMPDQNRWVLTLGKDTISRATVRVMEKNQVDASLKTCSYTQHILDTFKTNVYYVNQAAPKMQYKPHHFFVYIDEQKKNNVPIFFVSEPSADDLPYIEIAPLFEQHSFKGIYKQILEHLLNVPTEPTAVYLVTKNGSNWSIQQTTAEANKDKKIDIESYLVTFQNFTTKRKSIIRYSLSLQDKFDRTQY